jgi:hypothetical protein
MKRTILALAALAVFATAGVSNAAMPLGVAGAQFRYWTFSNDNTMYDWLAYWAPGPFDVKLEYWDFDHGADQFRPGAGVHFRDKRRAVYTVAWEHQYLQERFWLTTEQPLTKQLVGRFELSPIVTNDPIAEANNGGSVAWVVSAGTDYYWGSYNFAQATILRDPRQGGLWVFPMRARLANERNDWIQLGIAPASQRTVGWSFDIKRGWFRAGVERNNRYDFTTVDNIIFTVGAESPVERLLHRGAR